MASRSLWEHFSEDLEQLWLLDLSVSGFVDGLDEALHFLLGGGGAVGVNMLHSSTDEVEGFLSVKGTAVVLVKLSEDCVNSVSELLVSVAHLKQNIQYNTLIITRT